jgi:hypothetical protein
MGVDSIADFATEALDVASEVLSDGAEFLSDGFDQLTEAVGSFAGDAEWFNANSFGDIFGGTEPLGDLGGAGFGGGFFGGITDFVGDLRDSVLGPELLGGPGSGSFGIGSLINSVPGVSAITANLPSAITQQITGTAIKVGTNLVSSQIAQIPVVGSFAAPITRSLAGAVNPNIAQTPGFNPTAGINLSQLTGITPNIGIPNVPGIQLASLGPVPINLLKTPAGTVSVTGANGQPLSIQTPGFNPNAFSANAVSGAVNPQVDTRLIGEPSGTPLENPAEVPLSDLVTEPPLDTTPSASQVDTAPGNVGYIVVADPEGGFAVVNEQTGLPVATGLTEQQALLQAQTQTFTDAGESLQGGEGTVNINRSPNAVTNDINAVLADSTAGNASGTTFSGALFDSRSSESAITSALREQARQQQTIRDQRQNKAQSGDWRVRLRLAPRSNYLYNDPDCGPVLWPLQNTDGVIFPYTPAIDLAYKANYNTYDLTHSNYRGYFYQNSSVDQINVRATFTAQDTVEANYLLAVIHFFRSATKMFYGQDSQRGAPPPLVYISGYGDFQFAEHPLVISQFNYNLPADVNYIRAQTTTDVGTNLQPTARQRQTVASNPLSYAYQRLKSLGQGINRGALDSPFAPQGSLGLGNPSYVPTKIEISLVMLPMQSRQQVSQLFSLKGFANGNLLKGGFW